MFGFLNTAQHHRCVESFQGTVFGSIQSVSAIAFIRTFSFININFVVFVECTGAACVLFFWVIGLHFGNQTLNSELTVSNEIVVSLTVWFPHVLCFYKLVQIVSASYAYCFFELTLSITCEGLGFLWWVFHNGVYTYSNMSLINIFLILTVTYCRKWPLPVFFHYKEGLSTI